MLELLGLLLLCPVALGKRMQKAMTRNGSPSWGREVVSLLILGAHWELWGCHWGRRLFLCSGASQGSILYSHNPVHTHTLTLKNHQVEPSNLLLEPDPPSNQAGFEPSGRTLHRSKSAELWEVEYWPSSKAVSIAGCQGWDGRWDRPVVQPFSTVPVSL